ncbi:MAG: hypothetical protein KDI75_05360 [Xanthomonadales bacterium]|nr:hypothetical protein [Xanthomonadales bacterium]
MRFITKLLFRKDLPRINLSVACSAYNPYGVRAPDGGENDNAVAKGGPADRLRHAVVARNGQRNPAEEEFPRVPVRTVPHDTQQFPGLSPTFSAGWPV